MERRAHEPFGSGRTIGTASNHSNWVCVIIRKTVGFGCVVVAAAAGLYLRLWITAATTTPQLQVNKHTLFGKPT